MDDDFKLLRGFADRQMDGWTNKRTDICECRVAFATENKFFCLNNAFYWFYDVVFVNDEGYRQTNLGPSYARCRTH